VIESTAAHPQLLADQVSTCSCSSSKPRPSCCRPAPGSSTPQAFCVSHADQVVTVGFVGENELIPFDHDTTFDEVVLMPTDRKSIKVIERYSRELARQAIIGIDATLTNRLVKVVSDKLDDVLVGKGQATNEVQTITVAAGGNPFTLGFRGAVTSSIVNAAAAAIVQTAIQATPPSPAQRAAPTP
jgi:hypothetical protein